jgi:hypothetical protein
MTLLPTMDQFCDALAKTMTLTLIGDDVVVSVNEFARITQDLKKELTQAYTDAGSPYGTSENNMIQYMLENIAIEIEDEES